MTAQVISLASHRAAKLERLAFDVWSAGVRGDHRCPTCGKAYRNPSPFITHLKTCAGLKVDLQAWVAAHEVELEASNPNPRECAFCGRRISVRRRADAKYCRALCCELAAKERREVAHG